MIIRVFTHPVCTTCPTAIRMAYKVAERYPDVEVRVVSLGSAQGREEAKREGVLSVPTVIVGSRRFVGVPEWEALLQAVEAARNGS